MPQSTETLNGITLPHEMQELGRSMQREVLTKVLSTQCWFSWTCCPLTSCLHKLAAQSSIPPSWCTARAWPHPHPAILSPQGKWQAFFSTSCRPTEWRGWHNRRRRFSTDRRMTHPALHCAPPQWKRSSNNCLRFICMCLPGYIPWLVRSFSTEVPKFPSVDPFS